MDLTALQRKPERQIRQINGFKLLFTSFTTLNSIDLGKNDERTVITHLYGTTEKQMYAIYKKP